jgi:hypothetical protein
MQVEKKQESSVDDSLDEQPVPAQEDGVSSANANTA